MEKEIKSTVAKLKVGFAAVWIVAAIIFVCGETDLIPNGIMADDVRATYIFETITILLTATMLPVSLKLFNYVLLKKVDNESLPQALRHYRVWSHVRLMILLAVVIVGLVCYYLTMSKSSGLCALIGLIGTLFCIPGDERLRRELHIDKEG